MESSPNNGERRDSLNDDNGEEGNTIQSGEGDVIPPGGSDVVTPGEGDVIPPGGSDVVTLGGQEFVTPGTLESVTPVSLRTPGGVESLTPGGVESLTPGGVESLTLETLGSGGLTPALRQDGSFTEDEEDDKMLLIAPEILRVPEFLAIIQENSELIEQEKKLDLYKFPDLDELYETIAKNVQINFNIKTALKGMQKLYQLVVISRNNERSLKDRLAKKENETDKLKEKIRRDPKILQVLNLANTWREGKAAAEQNFVDYEITISTIKGDMKNLENKLHALQVLNMKLQKDSGKRDKIEDYIRQMEKAIFEQQQRISELLTEIDDMKNQSLKHEIEMLKKSKISVGSSKEVICLQELELERSTSRKKDSKITHHLKNIRELEMTLNDSRLIERMATNNFRMIAGSIKSLKDQICKLEAAIHLSNRRNERLTTILNQKDRKIGVLEQLVKQGKLNQESLKQMLTTLSHTNQMLKAQHSKQAYLEKRLTAHQEMKKALREKDMDIAECSKLGDDLTGELKLTMTRLHESKRQNEAQGRLLNNTKRQVISKHQSLQEAIIFNNSLLKRLDFTNIMLSHFKRKFEACTINNMDILNTIAHLDSVCREKETTIRIKDAKNDSLVLSLSNLQQLLREARVNTHRLRQLNLISQDGHRHQMELNDTIAQLMRFTEAEKESAFTECYKTTDTLVLLQKQQVMRLNKIAAQYRDICNLKTTISKHIAIIDIQKKETNALRDLLIKAQRQELSKKIEIQSLTLQRDKFGSMIIQKDVQCRLLQMKVIVLNKIIERGTSKYVQRANDVCILKLEIRNLRRKISAKENCNFVNEKLRKELVLTSRQLLLEKVKRRSLEDMMTTRVHRYQDIKFSDPSEYEKILKIHKLQKLLLVKCDEVTRKDKLIWKRDSQLKKMMSHLNRKPMNELVAEVQEAKATILQKNKQIKGLLSEVNLLAFDLSECRSKLGEVHKDLKTTKEEIAKHKRHAIKIPKALRPRDQTAAHGAIIWQRCFRPLSLIKSHYAIQPLDSVVANKETTEMAPGNATTTVISGQKMLGPTGK